MAKYAISPEGAAAMKSLARSLMMSANGIIEASATLFQKTTALSEGLGLYEAEILQIISKNKATLVSNKDVIVSLANTAKQMSENIESLFSFSVGVSSESGASSSGINPSAGGQRAQYCLGVLTNSSLPDGYTSILSQRHDSADSVAKKVFDRFANQLQIQDADYPPTEIAHYSPNSYPGHPRGVYYNADADSTNPRGAGSTYFHELGHMIDHAATGYSGSLSNTAEFGNALVSDGQAVLNQYNKLPPERQAAFLNRIRQDSMHSFSDLIDATTQGKLHGMYGHKRDYWEREGSLQSEAFAHFFEASMGCPEKRAILSNFFPNAFGVFSSMLESLQPNTLILERTR